MGGLNMDFSQRIEALKKLGFTETKVGMTNGKYAFLWYQIDTDAMSNEQFKEYIEFRKKTNNLDNTKILLTKI